MGNTLIRESKDISQKRPPVLNDAANKGDKLTNWNSFVDEVFKYQVGEDENGNLIPINIKRSVCALAAKDNQSGSGIINDDNTYRMGNYFNVSIPSVGILVDESIANEEAQRLVKDYYANGNMDEEVMKEELIPTNVALIWNEADGLVENGTMRGLNASSNDDPAVNYIVNRMNKYNKPITKDGPYANVPQSEIDAYLPNRWHALSDEAKRNRILLFLKDVQGDKESSCKAFVGTMCARELWENGCLTYVENTDPDDILNYPNQFIYGPLLKSTYRFDTTNPRCIINSKKIIASDQTKVPPTRVPNYLGFDEDDNFSDLRSDVIKSINFSRDSEKYQRLNPVYRVSKRLS